MYAIGLQLDHHFVVLVDSTHISSYYTNRAGPDKSSVFKNIMRDSTIVKNTGCSSRGPGFDSQCICGSSEPSVASVLRSDACFRPLRLQVLSVYLSVGSGNHSRVMKLTQQKLYQLPHPTALSPHKNLIFSPQLLVFFFFLPLHTQYLTISVQWLVPSM